MCSFGSPQNLPSLFDMPGELELFKDILSAVNRTLSQYCFELQFENYMNFYNLNKCINLDQKVVNLMQTDKSELIEFNVGLWSKSLISAINNLATARTPHYTVIQKFINYLLNAHLYTDFGLLEEFFYKLILLNPPRFETFEYYYSILNDSYVTLNSKHVEGCGLFDCLLEALINCLNSEKCEPNQFETNEILSEIKESFSGANWDQSLSVLHQEDITYFEDLCWSEKMKRCLCALNFIYNILETDFAFWLNSKEPKFYSSGEGSRPLMTHLLWPQKRDMGLIDCHVKKIIKMFILGSKLENCSYPNFCVIKKFLNLLCEIVRFCDRVEENKYPYLGAKSNNLARELTLKLYEVFRLSKNEREFFKVIDLIRSINSSWFRMLSFSHLLNYATGYQCSLDLGEMCDLSEEIAIVTKKKRKIWSESNFEESMKIKKLKKLKNVNAKRRGKTLLHLACETNDAEEVKALLAFPELDANARNRQGWTALHLAIENGNEDCVRELLRPRMAGESVITRVKGPEGMTPLMCAVKENRTEMCILLLDHSGSALLEDVNESDETPWELSKSDEITTILKRYENANSNSSTTRIHLENVEVVDEYRHLIIILCLEMMQSYFSTHKTLHVYRALKNLQKIPSHAKMSLDLKINPDWDYNRFHRDVIINIKKLEKLDVKLGELPELKSSRESFRKLLLIF